MIPESVERRAEHLATTNEHAARPRNTYVFTQSELRLGRVHCLEEIHYKYSLSELKAADRMLLRASESAHILTRGLLMRSTYMRQGVFIGSCFLMTLGTACVDDRLNDPEADGVPADRVNKPFYVAMFDHVPDEGEIQADFERFLLASRETSTALTHYPEPKKDPISGQKLVRIEATTGAGEFAGTHEGSKFLFRGTWELGSGAIESEDFALGKSGAENLDQGTVTIFHYLLTVPYVRDKFLKGKIVTISENGWYCGEIALYETNYDWVTRGQHLPFKQMIDYPSNSPSDSKPATDSSWLTYPELH